MTATSRSAHILAALLDRVGTLPTGLPVAYPEVSFTAPTDGKYLRVSYFTNRAAWEGLSAGEVAQGLLQISVIWPRNGGLISPLNTVGAVLAHFPNGLRLYSGGERVKVTGHAWAAAPVTEDTELQVPITIPWTA